MSLLMVGFTSKILAKENTLKDTIPKYNNLNNRNMTVYLINSYDIENLDEFKKYPSLVLPILQKYGAKVLASDTQGFALEGKAKTMNAIIEFPSEEAAKNCYNDPEYQAIKGIRINSTKNYSMIIVKQHKK